jgi:hypothetical protein
MAHTRQEWRDAMFRPPADEDRARTAAVSLSGLVGAILLVLGWHSGHIHNRLLVILGAVLLIAAVVQFAVFIFARLRGSP